MRAAARAPVPTLLVAPVLTVVLTLASLVALPSETAAAGSTAGQFVVRCPRSHTLADDPILFPGEPGASHLHDFYGNVTANAMSTTGSMLAGDTTCRVPSDTAGYWAPATYLVGELLEPPVMRIYYLGDSQRVETIPPGLQMIGGNAAATSPQENPHVRWYCGQIASIKTPIRDAPYDCSPWAQYAFVDGVIAIVEMPSCWNGTGLGPQDVTYPTSRGVCPPAFPHLLPRLSQRVHLGVMDPLNPDGSVALTLSSGEYYTMHSDFWNTWQQPRLDALVRDCLQAGIRCRAVDETATIDWTTQFGTQRYDLAYAAAATEDAVYVAGFTNQALPGQRYHRRYDAFVRKLDPAGRVRWTRQFGTSGTDQALALAADETGVWVVGSTDGRFEHQQALGGVDAFVARFGSNGRQRWLRQLGTPHDDEAASVALAGGDAFVAGSTDGRLGSRRWGGRDAFVGRIAGDGTIRWLAQFGSPAADRARGVAVDLGRVFVVGATEGALRGRTSEGATDAFVQMYRASGGRGWARQLGSAGVDEATAVLASSRSVYVAGVTDGTLPGQTALGETDGFLMRFDASGLQFWTRQFGTPAADDAAALAGTAAAIYVAGSTTGALPGHELAGETDAFVVRYQARGLEVWTLQSGTDDYDRAYGLAHGPGALYVVGTTHGAFEGSVNAGDRDVFVTRIALT